MQFYNFVNEETYYFFKWITESHYVKPGELIAKAFKDEENDQEDAAVALRSILEELFDEVFPALTDHCLDDFFSEDAETSLSYTLMSLSSSKIKFQAVAKALLGQAASGTPTNNSKEEAAASGR
jgi:hypothetical protein